MFESPLPAGHSEKDGGQSKPTRADITLCNVEPKVYEAIGAKPHNQRQRPGANGSLKPTTHDSVGMIPLRAALDQENNILSRHTAAVMDSHNNRSNSDDVGRLSKSQEQRPEAPQPPEHTTSHIAFEIPLQGISDQEYKIPEYSHANNGAAA